MTSQRSATAAVCSVALAGTVNSGYTSRYEGSERRLPPGRVAGVAVLRCCTGLLPVERRVTDAAADKPTSQVALRV